MQTTYRLKAKELSMELLESLKSAFTEQEVEVTFTIIDETPNDIKRDKEKLRRMIEENRKNAPVISPDIDIRALIDESHSCNF